VIRSWGYEVVEAEGLWRRKGDLAGSDENRLADLQAAIDDPAVQAVWAARGGWGSARLLSRLRLPSSRRRAKWLIGFSDLSAVQQMLFEARIASWYAPVVADLVDETRYRKRDLMAMLETPEAERVYRLARRGTIVPGVAEGVLAGGCLTLLAALAGTPWQPDFSGCIVFLEEVGEAPYRIDRLLWQLRHAGLFDGVRGIVFGQFTGCKAQRARSSRSLTDILREHARTLALPSMTGLAVGHGRRARAIPIGYHAEMNTRAAELRVRPHTKR